MRMSETYEEYTVYVDSGDADEMFREFCREHEVETCWRDTHYV